MTGWRLYELRRYDAALIAYQRAIYKEPKDCFALYQLGRCLLKLHRPEDAAAAFQAALQLTPDSPATLYEQSVAYSRTGRDEKAIDTLRYSINLGAEHYPSFVRLGSLLLEQRRGDEALSILQAAEHLVPSEKRGDYFLLLAKVHFLREDRSAFLTVIETARLSIENNSELKLFEAQALAYEGRFEEAKGALQRFIMSLPRETNSFFKQCADRLRLLSREFYRAKFYEAASFFLEESMSLVTDRFPLLFELGRCQLKLGKNAAAISSLQQCLHLRPEHLGALVEIGCAYSRERRNNEATATFNRVLELNPDSPEANLWLARIFRTSGNHGEALKFAEKAYALKNTDDTCEEYARALYVNKRFQEAKELLQETMMRAPSRASTVYEYAKLLRNTGDYSRALKYAQKAKNLNFRPEAIQQLVRVIEGDLVVYESQWHPKLKNLPTAPESLDTGALKVIHLLESSLPHQQSGYTVRSQSILRSQRQLGITPVVVTRPGFPRDRGVELNEACEIHEDMQHYRLALSGEPSYNNHPLNHFLQTYTQQAYAIAYKQRAHIIHATSNFKNGLVGKAIADQLDKPFVYELRGLWEDTQISKGIIDAQSERYKYFQKMENYCLDHADSVVTISQTLKQELSSRGIPEEKVFVVPNAVESEHFPILVRDEELAAKLGLQGKLVVGYISSFIGYEGIGLLIEAFADIVKATPNARLLLVGDGEERSNLANITSQFRLEDKVIFTGKVPHSEVLSYYSLIDLFVVPRLPYRVCQIVTPLKPYEAMSTGRALLVSDVEALKEMIIEGETGVSFTAGNAEHLAKQCIGLLHNESLRKSLGEKASTWVRQNRNWNNVAQTYFDAYDYAALRLGNKQLAVKLAM